MFGEEFLSPLKKTPPAKNVTSDSSEHSLLTLQNVDETKLSKKELSDLKKLEKGSKDKESLSPKNAQNAHEAIRPAETDGKVRTVMHARTCVCVYVYVYVREREIVCVCMFEYGWMDGCMHIYALDLILSRTLVTTQCFISISLLLRNNYLYLLLLSLSLTSFFLYFFQFPTPDETLLTGEKKLLYGLIYRRTLASVMTASQVIEHVALCVIDACVRLLCVCVCVCVSISSCVFMIAYVCSALSCLALPYPTLPCPDAFLSHPSFSSFSCTVLHKDIRH